MKRLLVKHVAGDNLDVVIGLLHGDKSARRVMVKKVLDRHRLPSKNRFHEQARESIERFLDEVQEGERPLYSEWESFSIKQLENYIRLVKQEREKTVNPYVRYVMDKQWDQAYLYWILKGGNHLKEGPLGEEVENDAF